MGPGLKYTLARFALLVAVFLVLLPVPIDLLLKLVIAIIVSAVLSYFLLRGMREAYARRLQDTFERRKTEKDQLRSALAGEEQPPAAPDKQQDEPDTDGDSDGPSKSGSAQ